MIHEGRHHLSGLRPCDDRNPAPAPCYSSIRGSDVVNKPRLPLDNLPPPTIPTAFKDTVEVSESHEQSDPAHLSLDTPKPVHTSTPVEIHAISSPAQHLTFSDEQGKPIAIDQELNQYRLSKRHIRDPSVPRHLPFDQSTNSGSKSDEDIAFDTKVLKAVEHKPTEPRPADTGARPKRNAAAPAKFKDYITGKDLDNSDEYEKSFHDFVNKLHPVSSPRPSITTDRAYPVTPIIKTEQDELPYDIIPFQTNYRSRFDQTPKAHNKTKPVTPPTQERPKRKIKTPNRFLN